MSHDQQVTLESITSHENVPANGLAPEDLCISNIEPDLKVECRICQEEDLLYKMESPCACTGTIKYAHRRCVQRWCNEKQNTFCEICHRTYQPNYIVQLPPSPLIIPCPHHSTVDISEGYDVSSLQHQSAMAAAAHHLRDIDYDNEDCVSAVFRGSRTCRLVLFLIQLASCCIVGLLLAIMMMTNNSAKRPHDHTAYYLAFGMIIPCYIMAGATNFIRLLRDRPVTLAEDRQERADVAIAIPISPRPAEHLLGGDLESALVPSQHPPHAHGTH